MAQAQIRTFLLITAAAGMLTACVDGLSMAPATADSPAQKTRIVTRDIEAPEVFQTSAMAHWDGRPSLGGVWIAAPGITDPERVIIRNPANGKFVIGTLFRRAPRPTAAGGAADGMQLSSDAAQALEVPAGAALRLDVTALRRADGGDAPDPKRPLLDSAESIGSGPADAIAAAAQAQAREAQRLQIPATPVPAPARAASLSVAPSAAPSGPPSPAPAVRQAALSAPAAPAERGAKAASQTIQLGLFSQEANARRAQALAAKAGLGAEIKRETSQGKKLWSVSARGSAADLARVKALGLPDAYFLKR